MGVGAKRGIEVISRKALGMAAHAGTLQELAEEVTGLIGPGLPHDGYGCQVAGGLDSVVGAVMLHAGKHNYSPQATFGLAVQHCAAVDHYPLAPPGSSTRLSPVTSSALSTNPQPGVVQLNPLGALIGGAHRSVAAFSTSSPKNDVTARLHDIMSAEGIGSDLRIAVTMRGRMWGVITLLRERGAKPFTADDLVHAERLSDLLAVVLRRFTARIPTSPVRAAVPGTVIFDRADRVSAMTPAGRDWLRDVANDPTRGGGHDPHTALLGPVVAARKGIPPVITTVPTRRGWASVHAQPLDGGRPGDVAVTIQPASGAELLSAVAACRGITPRERTVIEQALGGLPSKQIARRLGLSPHTVNDHFKAIHRKIGVTSREELLAVLIP